MPKKKWIFKQYVINSWPIRMRKNNIMQKDVAEKSGITATTISNAINGNKIPHDSTIEAVEVALQEILRERVKDVQ